MAGRYTTSEPDAHTGKRTGCSGIVMKRRSPQCFDRALVGAGCTIGLRAFTPQFVARRSGTIAIVSSVVGLSAVPMMAGYSASKAALHSITQSLRGTLEKDDVTVVGIYPGPIETVLATQVPYPKATPEHAAANIVKGLAEGRTYIFPDPMAQQVEQLWSTDNRKLEHVALHLGA
jgi:short-subunit dehydrogenase